MTQKNQDLKNMKKNPGDIIILHMCTKNYDHIMYSSWDMFHDRWTDGWMEKVNIETGAPPRIPRRKAWLLNVTWNSVIRHDETKVIQRQIWLSSVFGVLWLHCILPQQFRKFNYSKMFAVPWLNRNIFTFDQSLHNIKQSLFHHLT